jgi:hypothetical protein
MLQIASLPEHLVTCELSRLEIVQLGACEGIRTLLDSGRQPPAIPDCYTGILTLTEM